jgi:hypothetical protein
MANQRWTVNTEKLRYFAQLLERPDCAELMDMMRKDECLAELAFGVLETGQTVPGVLEEADRELASRPKLPPPLKVKVIAKARPRPWYRRLFGG